MATERPAFADERKAGEKFFEKNISFQIVEVVPLKDFMGRRMVQIAYRIIDGDYTSPVAHLFLYAEEDVKLWVKRVVDNYLSAKESILRR
jgi:hypothetical protein